MQNPRSQVVVLTKIPAPWYAPRFMVISKMRETIPQYEALPGLAYKYYTIAGDRKFGGLYLWKDRSAAQAWFNDAWFAEVLKSRGAPAQVRYFEAPVTIDNVPKGGPAPGADGNATAAIVTIRTPAGLGRERLIEEFNKAVPHYQKVTGLHRKYFIITDDGKFGGIYLWATRVAAERFYDAAWQARIKKNYGAAADIEYLSAPVILPSRLTAHAATATAQAKESVQSYERK